MISYVTIMTRRTSSSEQTRKSLNVELARRVDVAGGASAVLARSNSFHLVVERCDEGVGVVDTCTSTIVVPSQYPCQRSPKFCRTTLVSRYSVNAVAVLLDGKFSMFVT